MTSFQSTIRANNLS